MLNIRCVLKNKNRKGLLLEVWKNEPFRCVIVRPGSKSEKPRSAKEICEAMLPRDTQGRIALPVRYIVGSLKAAGHQIPFQGKAMLTNASGKTFLHEFLWIEENDGFLPLFNGDRTGEPEWHPLKRGTRNDRDEPVVKLCPRIIEWTVEFSLVIKERIMSEERVRNLVKEAGRRSGIGQGRPQKGGHNGQFIIDEWEVLGRKPASMR